MTPFFISRITTLAVRHTAIGFFALITTSGFTPARAVEWVNGQPDGRVEPTDRLSAAERAFLAEAREVIRQQRRLGELGLTHARTSEVRSHAHQITTDYRLMADAIDGLIRKKSPALIQTPAIPSEPYQDVAARSGAEFERVFVMTLVDLHERTISLFENAMADATDPDLRQMVAAQLPILREHRNRITVLRKTYY